MGGIEYYVEQFIEEHEGKAPLQVFYENPKPIYELATPDPKQIVSTKGTMTWRPPEGFNWETASPEERREIYESHPKEGTWKYGGAAGVVQDAVENTQKIFESIANIFSTAGDLGINPWYLAIGGGFLLLLILVLAVK